MPEPLVREGPDVIVVGGGLAGVCAALAAREGGASVTVLDGAHGGGSSAISGGVVYAGGGTRAQREAGYGGDTPANMYRYLAQEAGGAVAAATLRRFCDESVARLEWLQGHGVVFAGTLCPHRTSYPAGPYALYFSGNEKAHPYAAVAEPAPRGHRVVGAGAGAMNMTGNVLWGTLFDAAVRAGVRFEFASKVERLLSDGAAGAVRGVQYRALDPAAGAFAKHKALAAKGARYHRLSVPAVAGCYDRRADALWRKHAVPQALGSRSVILAAGGFGMNERMVSESIPWSGRVCPLGTAGDDGSGIRLGQSAGGAVSHMHRMSAWRLMYPPESLSEGVVVSCKGERIAAEDLYGASFSDAMIERAGGRGYLILDSAQWRRVKSQIWEQTQMPWRAFILYLVYWAHKRARSVPALARKLGIDPVMTQATVDAYNDALLNQKPDPVGKLGWRTSIQDGPFYGIDISLKRGGMLVVPALPLGGLQVEESTGLLVRKDGSTIPHLYAAGKTAAGICSNSYVSGLALADCVFSGKRAGEHAATH